MLCIILITILYTCIFRLIQLVEMRVFMYIIRVMRAPLATLLRAVMSNLSPNTNSNSSTDYQYFSLATSYLQYCY